MLQVTSLRWTYPTLQQPAQHCTVGPKARCQASLTSTPEPWQCMLCAAVLACLPVATDCSGCNVEDLATYGIQVRSSDTAPRYNLVQVAYRECQSLQPHRLRFPVSLPRAHSAPCSLAYVPLIVCSTQVSSPVAGLHSLSLTGSSLSRLPEAISCITSLGKLQIQDCHSLICLPEGMSSLRSLTCLELNRCFQLASLSGCMTGLTSLADLQIKYCHTLTQLPEGIGQLRSLARLRLHGCSQLSSLPVSISGLRRLRQLEVAQCPRLRCLPEGISGLPRLNTLTLVSCHQLASLGDCVSGWTRRRAARRSACLTVDDCPRLAHQREEGGGFRIPTVRVAGLGMLAAL